MLSLRHQVKSKFKIYKNSTTKSKDKPISALESIKFIQDKTKPKYDPSIPNLGLAEELILDCYSGICNEEKWRIDNKKVCSEDSDGDTICHEEKYRVKYYTDRIDYKCSFECFELQENTCNNCTNSSSKYNDTKGRYTRNTKDNYSYEKYCLSDNVIYFWKGGKYEGKLIKNDHGYLNNAILKNEECPQNKKYCGILDDNGNKFMYKRLFKLPYKYNI